MLEADKKASNIYKKVMGFIYKITSPLGRVYVGKTKDLKRRIGDYRWRNKKHKSFVCSSINKYGWDAHKFEVIEECSDDVLSEREIFWIKELNTYYVDNPEFGMNLTTGGEKGARNWMHDIERRKRQSIKFSGEGGTFYGKKHTQETKEILSKKASERNKLNGHKVPEWGAEKGRVKIRRAVVQYNSMGVFVKEFISITEAANHNSLNIGSVKDSVLYGSWINGEHLFVYKTDNYPTVIEIGEIKKRTEKRAIYWLSEDLEPICEFPSAQEASDFFGIPKTTINRAAMYNDMNPIRTGHIFFYKDLYLEEYKLSA